MASYSQYSEYDDLICKIKQINLKTYVDAKELSLLIPYTEKEIINMAKNGDIPHHLDLNSRGKRQRIIFNRIDIFNLIESRKQDARNVTATLNPASIDYLKKVPA